MTVTASDTALRTAVSEDEVGEGVNAPYAQRVREDSVPETAPSALTEREDRRVWWHQLRPPEPWLHRPSSLAAMWRYAWRGAWTGEPIRQVRDSDEAPWRNVHADETVEDLAGKTTRTRHPLSRRLGVWWFRLVAIPVSVLAHYAAWIIARPSRTVVVVLLWSVAMQVQPVRAVAEVLLPWDPWPWPWSGS